MTIIVRPNSINKGETVEISLSKEGLASLPIVANDPYFQNMANWQKVNLNYVSSVGNQHKLVEFFPSGFSAPVGTFSTSIKARDVFQIESIQIIDFDHQILYIPRTLLDVKELDIYLGISLDPLILLENGDTLTLESDNFVIVET